MLLLIMVAVSVASIFFSIGVVSLPLSDQGPHIAHGWGQVVRLRHLYAARPGLHLLISGDGQIQGSADQTLYSKWSILKHRLSINHSNDWRWLGAIFNSDEHWTAGLLEIHPVDPGCVVIRGAATARFLCIEGDGKLYSSVRISQVKVASSWQFMYEVIIQPKKLIDLGFHICENSWAR